MKIDEMQMSDIETRSAEIEELLKGEDADIESLTKEVEEMEARKAEILAEVEQRKKEAEEALKIGTEIEKEEERKMTNMEVRNTKEYIDAFAEYVKSGNDAECRALLTENVASGTVPVPEMVYNIVKTAWDREGIMALVRKTAMKGNLKVGFEISADGAVVHTESILGTDEGSEVLLELLQILALSLTRHFAVGTGSHDFNNSIDFFLRITVLHGREGDVVAGDLAAAGRIAQFCGLGHNGILLYF